MRLNKTNNELIVLSSWGQKQLEIIKDIFGNENESQQRAFEDFGNNY